MKNTIKRIAAMVLVLALLAIGVSSVAMAADNEYMQTTARLYLRMGPGTGYDSITCLDKGEKVIYLDYSYAANSSCWYKVQRTDGTKGWCCSDYLTYAGYATGKVKLTGDSHIRTAASLDGISLSTAVRGTTLSYDRTATDNRGVTWYHITYYGTTGWISSKYTKKV